MKALLHKIHLPNWLIGVLALILILRIPSFFEPYYYGDEMIYLTLGQGVRQALTLYSQIFDNKPPLIYLVAAISENLFWFRTILAFWNLATIVIFFRLAERLALRGIKIATLIFALATTLPLLEGHIANAELFMIGPLLLAFYLLLGEKLKIKVLFFAGMFFGISTLFKVPAAFDLPVIIVFWLITDIKRWKEIIKNTVIIGVGFLTPLVLTFVYYLTKGALGNYFTAAFMQNVGYLGSLTPPINIPFIFRVLTVVVGIVIFYLFRKKLSKKFILFGVWTLFSLFAAALSQRPYPHYLLQAAAPAAFLLAMLFTEKTKEQALAVIPLALIFFVPFFYKYYHYETLSYYTRFIQFSLGKTSKEEYFASFSPKTQRNYLLAEFLNKSSRQSDRVFVWDPDSPIIHALSRRLPPTKFTVPYHVFDYSSKETVIAVMSQNQPKFIILTSKNPLPEIMDLISQRYILVAQIDDADIYSKLSGVTF
jgi:4-amino-4-deoxy-L-arabinose transferase-like glycosyltransferase